MLDDDTSRVMPKYFKWLKHWQNNVFLKTLATVCSPYSCTSYTQNNNFQSGCHSQKFERLYLLLIAFLCQRERQYIDKQGPCSPCRQGAIEVPVSHTHIITCLLTYHLSIFLTNTHALHSAFLLSTHTWSPGPWEWYWPQSPGSPETHSTRPCPSSPFQQRQPRACAGGL